MSEQFDDLASSLNRFCAAWAANDGVRTAGFFVEDGSLINPFGQRADGRSAVAAMYTEYFGGMLHGTTTTFAISRIRPVEQDYAFADAEQVITGPDGNVLLAVHVASLMRREDGEWRLVDSRPYAFAQS